MKARDVMAYPVFTVRPDAPVKEVAVLLLEKRISAVPVVDKHGKLVGIVSEGDLIHRPEAGTEKRRSWWLHLVTGSGVLAADYVKANSLTIAEVMTKKVVTAGPETRLEEIAALLEKHAIKRVPIVEDGKPVGIVSRANLVQAVASAMKSPDTPLSDTAIRDRLLAKLKAQPWANTRRLNVTVHDGVVSLWGTTSSDAERAAIRVAAQSIPGVREVNDQFAVWHRDFEISL